MKTAVVVFPASNCDRDAAIALTQFAGSAPSMVWHAETELPPADLIVLPGGFAHGDYLRCGAIAARSAIMPAIAARAAAGVPVLGICNGFQVLTEAGLLPGALLRNAGMRYVCDLATLRVEGTQNMFLRGLNTGDYVRFPVAHGEGNYTADDETLDRLEGEGQVAFRYVDDINGSARRIAGIVNPNGNVLGLMPHPERVISPLTGGDDGVRFFRSLISAIA